MFKDLEGGRSEKGFSLIELIVVLVILGLLAAVVGPKLINKIMESKGKIAKIQIAEFENALQMYSLDIGHLPPTSAGLAALVQNVEGNESWNGPYLAKDLPLDPWQRPYAYRSPGAHNNEFDIWTFGADNIDGNADDVCSWNQQ